MLVRKLRSVRTLRIQLGVIELGSSSSDHPVFVREPEDEDEDDQEPVVDFPVDKTFNRLINYIYEQYPDSYPHSDPVVPPRCEFESFFATTDPQLVGRQKLRWYLRAQEITAKTQECMQW